MLKLLCGVALAAFLASSAEARAADFPGNDGRVLYAYHLPRRVFGGSMPCRIGDYPLSTTTAQPLRTLHNMPVSCLGFPRPGIVLMRLPRAPASVLRGAYPIAF